MVEAGIESVTLFFAEALVGFRESEGVSDHFSGVAVVTEIDLTLDALFELGIESERHGDSIPLGAVHG